MRKPIIAGNWKMHLTVPEARELVDGILPQISGKTDVEVIVAPVFTALGAMAERLKGTNIRLAAQNMHWEVKGAFTGEVSPVMLKDIGCEYVILGHSERRQFFGDTDETVNLKVKSALAHGLKVILCIGESLEERNTGVTFKVLEKQLSGGLKDVALENVTIAYEPIWAIGTGVTATDEQANEAHEFVRSWLRLNYGADDANGVRILYGGSVKPENVDGLMAQPEIDGALVGGASMKADSFARLVNFKK